MGMMFLCLYVDDGLVFTSSKVVQDDFLRNLKARFEVTSHKPETYVGMTIKRNRERQTIDLSGPSWVH